jgi:hypothetical protein
MIVTLATSKYDSNSGNDLPMLSRSGKSTIPIYSQFKQNTADKKWQKEISMSNKRSEASIFEEEPDEFDKKKMQREQLRFID